MRPFLRHSLRRYIHSFPPVAHPRRVQYSTKFTIGLSFVAAAYVGWQIAGNDRRIALDTPPPTMSQKTNAAADTPPPKTDEPARSEPSVPVESGHVEPPENTNSENTSETEEGEGAFNPVTGEINWDCPCLGGMAHGPCGQQFREAFSCFVYSEKEPKGIDCVDKFKNMQDCFRAHPDIYGEEIADDEDAPESSSTAKDAPSQPQPITQSQETTPQERAAS